jgi:signal transduction histidine kinase
MRDLAMAASVKPDAVNGIRLRATRSGELVAVRDDIAGLLAHDLKTPLAAISMNLDYVLDELGKKASGPLRSALEDCRAANSRAIRIVTDMADAVRLASGERRVVLTDVDVSALLGGLVRAAAPEAAARGVRMVWCADSENARADADLLSRALDRLLERALRHARTGGAIEINLRHATVTIRVKPGPGDHVDPTPPDAAMRALGTFFAEAALRAQGGAVWTETDADGSLLFCAALGGR